MQQNGAQIGKIMSSELKSHQYKQQITFSGSEINSNVIIFVLFIHSTINNIEQKGT